MPRFSGGRAFLFFVWALCGLAWRRASPSPMGGLALTYIVQGLLGAALGLLYARWGLGRAAGSIPKLHPTAWPLLWRGMIVIPVPWTPGRCLHVHHWLVCSAAVPSLAAACPVAAGAALSLALQGLTYADRFTFMGDVPPDYTPPRCWARALTRN